MGRSSFKDKLVASGVRTVRQRGFATAGLREITAAAGVAQGSFTNHFASKEEFGVAVLDRYFASIRAIMADTLRNPDLRPVDRLNAYFDVITHLFAEDGWRYGCLAGNMGLEAAEHSEVIRLRLREIFDEWAQPFAEAVREAQGCGDVPPDLDAVAAGAALLDAWHGAMLRMKVERSAAPLVRFRQVIFPAVLQVNEQRRRNGDARG